MMNCLANMNMSWSPSASRRMMVVASLKRRMRHSFTSRRDHQGPSDIDRDRESGVMVLQSRKIGHRHVPVVVLWAILLIGPVRAQAPGDGDAICTDEIFDGVTNPFFAIHPVYSASDRPLMDSRDYNRLLHESGNVYIPWQSVDRDNNNTNEALTRVSIQRLAIIINKKRIFYTPVDSNCNICMCWSSDRVWIQ